MEVNPQHQHDDGAPVADHADLAHIERQAAALEGAAAADLAADLAAVPTGNAEQLHDALKMARVMVRPMFAWWREFDATWSPEQVEQIAQAGGAVMDKHGWSFGDVMAGLGPYIALAIATVPPGMATFQAIKAKREADERAARAPRPAPQPAP